MKRLPRWPVEVCAVLVLPPRAREDAVPSPCYRRLEDHGPQHDLCTCLDTRAAHLEGSGSCGSCYPRCLSFTLAEEDHDGDDSLATVQVAREALAEVRAL